MKKTFINYLRLLIAALSFSAWCLPVAAQAQLNLGAIKAASDAAQQASHDLSVTNARSAFSTAQTTVTNIQNSGIVSQISTVHDKFKTYPWRTVYEFSQVPKTPFGTRLGLTAIAAMSQLDAENYLNTYLFNGQLPALNCPVAQLGGPAGRTMQYSDTVIRDALIAVGPANGVPVWDAFNAFKVSVCAAIYNTAQLQFRLDKYSAVATNWNECATNGVQLTGWSVSNKFSFDNGGYANLSRTAAAGGGVLFKCGSVYNGTTSDMLTYDSWFKWSDEAEKALNLYQMIKEAGNTSTTNCPTLCVPVIGAASEATGSICVGVSPDISAVTADTAPLKLGLKIQFASTEKFLCSPVINVPAPFGVASSLSEMADTAKTQALTSMKSQLSSLMPTMTNAISKLTTATSAFQAISPAPLKTP